MSWRLFHLRYKRCIMLTFSLLVKFQRMNPTVSLTDDWNEFKSWQWIDTLESYRIFHKILELIFMKHFVRYIDL